MNSIKPVKAEDFARSLGLPSDEAGLPTRGSIAEAVRSFVSVNRVADRDELEEWFLTLASAAGYTGEMLKKRFRSVCSQLLAAGDCAAASRESSTFLISVEPKTVDLETEEYVILGDAPGEAMSGAGKNVIRRVGRQQGSVSLFDHLSPPPWPAIAESLALNQDTSPSQILTSVRLSGGLPEHHQQSGLERKYEVSLQGTSSRLCLAADGEQDVPLLCFQGEQGNERRIRLDSDEYLSWLYLSETGIDGTRDWPEDLPLPSTVLAALTLVGEPLDDDLTRWDLSDKARTTLSEWLGIPLAEQTPVTRDPAQSKVIDSSASARLLVAAGPGSGKTWTACMRVSRLIEAGTSPSRILIISFTRAAVAEIRGRIASFLKDPRDAYQLNIQTLDSLAWSLNAGAGGGSQTSGDFDGSISAALKLFADPEDWLLDEIERYQHVLIDEAQDLTGARRALVLAMLRNITDECGVSVFHDPAQAIYGFLDVSLQGVEKELESWEPPFENIALDRNYRCKSPGLEAMFSEGRSLLRDTGLDAREIYSRIRQRIEETASPANTRRAADERRDTFYLYRWRGQLNSAIDQALRNGTPFRTRLSQHRNLVQPWIAATLHNFVGRAISRSEFVELYSELRPHPGLPAEQAWQSLCRICGTTATEIDLARLAEIMLGRSPLPEVAISDVGPRSAPLFSTIHAAKGREAETVVLSLPFEPNDKTDDDLLEEARVLYVAATRASSELRLAASPRGMKTLNNPSRRTWREWSRSKSPAAKVEIGCPGDIEPTPYSSSSQSRDDANFVLWQSSERAQSVGLTFADGRYRITMSDTGIEIGTLSNEFNMDLRSIAEKLTQEKVYPARNIEGAFMLGATSVANLDEAGMPSFTLVPILSGAPLVFFNRA
ncbi:UvrD-helicase domain-containing protein [Erythrobacter aurantius]|uniref:UvrD-helicase domain-containing protein n=1 Tax=Erythrobacter aurantius TaxID=2909249 RepID=UPI00207A0F07|nr:UvrD-helicase domain-containing protein [Erythrobacter aurantius]